MACTLRVPCLASPPQCHPCRVLLLCAPPIAARQVEMWLVARRRLANLVPGRHVGAGERVLVEVSRKFSPQCISALAYDSRLCLEAAWGSPRYRMQLLLPPEPAFRRAWADSDRLFAHVREWGGQPIALRHPFVFYYAHSAAFAKLKMLPEVGRVLHSLHFPALPQVLQLLPTLTPHAFWECLAQSGLRAHKRLPCHVSPPPPPPRCGG